jgi:putative photosynthetic complex assembly protein 2
MLHYAAPALYALFLWWFSTGAILYLDGLPKRTFRWSMLAATAILAIALVALKAGNQDLTTAGAYRAFSFGLLAWGWQEISFYLGVVTGLRTEPCPDGCSGWRHFGHAIRVSLFHELAIIATAAAVYLLVWPGANHIGFWTYVVLWWMHQSAKLNVFLGVRNLNEEFLPDHMAFLKSFLTKKPMNPLFPVSVTVSTVIAVLIFQKALSPMAGDFERTGFLFLGALMTLAILEHWFLVLPLPSQALWGWSLKSRAPQTRFDVEIVAGFLGAGKTTYLRRLLAAADANVRTIVLVNDFGAMGIDGSLLSGHGAEVVELPNGCICCSLSQDFAGQLVNIVARWAPRRIMIEPSGVADVAEIVAAMERPELRRHVRRLRVCTIVDAGSFLRDYARMFAFFEAQAMVATRIILNKIDIADPAEVDIIEDTLAALNPTAQILRARHGLASVGGADPASLPQPWRTIDHSGKNGGTHDDKGALGLTSWSARLNNSCHPQGLRSLLDAIAQGSFGQVERVKGIACVGAGWVHFDIAGGRSTVAAFAPSPDEEQRVVAIGRTFDITSLQAAFDACTEQGRQSC